MDILTLRLACCVCAVIITLPAPASAAEALSPTEYLSRQKSFVRRLHNEKDYFNCIAETRRLIIHFPRLREEADYLYFIEMNYYLWGQYKTVVTRYERTAGPAFRHSLLAAAGYGALNRHDRALTVLEGLKRETLSRSEHRELLLRTADHLIERADYAAALRGVRAYLPAGPDDNAISSLGRELERYRELPLKSVPLAVSLSALLPGAGQVYAGRPRDGMISLAALSALAAGSLLSLQHGDRTIGMSLGVMAVLVYGGTVYGAYNAAESRNRIIHGDYRDYLRHSYIPPYEPGKYFTQGMRDE